jgi:hypothetical protein
MFKVIVSDNRSIKPFYFIQDAKAMVRSINTENPNLTAWITIVDEPTEDDDEYSI